MKKTFLYCALACLPMAAAAQSTVQTVSTAATPETTVQQGALRFGYFSFKEVFHTMPGYAIAKHNMDDLKAKYDAETKRSEDEFNSKYEEFLDGQRNFAPTILQKRQAELRELMAKNIAFKAEAERLLAQAETEAYAPLKAQIKNALQRVGKEKGFAFIMNADDDVLPYTDSTQGEDITALLKEKLK